MTQVTPFVGLLLSLVALVVGHRFSYSLGVGGDGGLGTLFAAGLLALLAGLFVLWHGVCNEVTTAESMKRAATMAAWTLLPTLLLGLILALSYPYS